MNGKNFAYSLRLALFIYFLFHFIMHAVCYLQSSVLDKTFFSFHFFALIWRLDIPVRRKTHFVGFINLPHLQHTLCPSTVSVAECREASRKCCVCCVYLLHSRTMHGKNNYKIATLIFAVATKNIKEKWMFVRLSRDACNVNLQYM